MSERMELIKLGEITVTGKATLAVTIPGDQVEILGLHKGDPYRMYKEGGRLVIEFGKAEPEPEPEGEKKPGEVF